MKKFKLGKDALILSIITLLTVLTWIGFDVYRAAHQTTITKVTEEQMVSLDPKIKTETLESLKSNLSFSEEELKTTTTPMIESTETTTPEGEQTSTESAALE